MARRISSLGRGMGPIEETHLASTLAFAIHAEELFKSINGNNSIFIHRRDEFPIGRRVFICICNHRPLSIVMLRPISLQVLFRSAHMSFHSITILL